VKYAHSKILLVVVPASAPTEPDRWDVAILRHFGGGDGNLDVSGHHWPEGAKPTMLWVK